MDEDLKTQTALTTALADAMERAPGGGWAAWLILDAILGQDFANARAAIEAYARADFDGAARAARGEASGPAVAEAHCAGCTAVTPVDRLDPQGRCWVCADHRVCPDCEEHYAAADGPCACVVERNELAEARRDEDREHFDAAHQGADDAAVAA